MEEASVAGESPDRSKQRESSEEPTSGSAGPVPEARTEASETPDPRLAVAREDAKPAASAGSSESPASGASGASGASAGSRGGVDTATRVLSVPRAEAEDTSGGDAEGASEDTGPRTTAEDGPAEASEASGASDTAEEPGSSDAAGESGSSDAAEGPGSSEASDASDDDRAEADAPSDGRLRNAVAAWVATADERAAANSRLEDAEGSGDAEESAEDTPAAAAAEPVDDESNGRSDAPEDAEKREDDRVAVAADGDANGDTGPDTDTDTDSGADTDGTDADTDAGERPVDQPTAVFKAPRLSAPGVDQPTTMLKLGDAANASKKAGEGSETDAERTSKFVALRQPDDPATRKPPQSSQPPSKASGAPQALPTGATAAVPQVGPERTRQQPLPPKPPLDLLAELTNTPPPPETPLRTTVRRVKIWTPLVILLVIAFGVVQSMRSLPTPTLDLTAQDSFAFEGGKPEIPWPSSGQAALDVQGIGTFGSSGDQKPVPIASVAKVMTAYVVLRDHPLESGAEGPKIPIDQAAEDQSEAGQESTAHVYAGDSISQREALEAVLIASANNVARLLARWDAGSEKAFVEKMNDAAKDLGMTNTTYTDPSGLDDTTVSTAVDQVKLAKEAMKSPAFREVAAKMSYDDYKGVNHPNWNQLVGSNNVVGIKTGTTTSALGNLVFAAKKEIGGETRTIVGAVVRQPAGGKDNTILSAALTSGDKLIRAAQDTLESRTILKKGSVVGYVDDGLGGRTPVVATQDVKAVGWPGLTVKLTFKADEVPHTAAAGTKVGTLTVGDGGAAGAVQVPVALQEELVEPAFTDKLTRLG
ncbi:D-alanyl-D-alanine carboxypeptidase [Streptomyces sp. NPDC057363]|uniref:D-alanyl-D-alanine carboxypeptidase n=1 Tax=Streptomyces sp. NPDC057363 TaxID=3346107 RepID=UPI00363A58D8